MRVKTQKSSRNRAIAFLLMPAVVFLWVIGWSLYWLGHQRDGNRSPDLKPSMETVHIGAIPFGENQEIRA